MFPQIRSIFDALTAAEVDDPLDDTLQLLDILTAGALRDLEPELESKIELPLSEFIKRRRSKEPVPYILGRTSFMGLIFQCRPGALIPRAETELLVRAVLERLPADQSPVIIDMCTGSGNIAVALAAHHRRCIVHAADISPEALAIAREHVHAYQFEQRINLYCGDMFAPLIATGLAGTADVVVCNPPYIPTKTLAGLAADIRDHEPHEALHAGPYGINFFRRLLQDAPGYLRSGGLLAFEIGAGQERLVHRLLVKAGRFQQVEPYYDQSGVARGFTAVTQ